MAEKKRLAKQPMLYIAQPNFKPAEVQMQTSFRSQGSTAAPSASEPSHSQSDSSLQEKELRLRNQSATTLKDVEESKAEEEVKEAPENKEQSPSKPKSSREGRQRFQNLSLEEKVNYFFNLSPHVPKMKCEVTTETNQFRGYITKYEDGIVHMKVFQRPFHQEVPFEDIQDIRLIGF